MGSDDAFRIRQVPPVGARFCFWARWPRVFTGKTRCYILIDIIALSNSQRSRDKVDSQMILLKVHKSLTFPKESHTCKL